MLHIPHLRRYARALVHNDTTADDLVQETLERALRKFSLWKPGSNLRAWLFSVMHNVYLNQVRVNRDCVPYDESMDIPVKGKQEDGPPYPRRVRPPETSACVPSVSAYPKKGPLKWRPLQVISTKQVHA
jgi:RNA polymerase sigma factor (sigma-70 family)